MASEPSPHKSASTTRRQVRRITFILDHGQFRRLEALLVPPSQPVRRTPDLIAFAAAALVLVGLFLIKLPQAGVDAELRVTELQFEVNSGSQTNIIPGESGQILMLKRAVVSGLESGSPEGASNGGRLDLRTLPGKGGGEADAASRADRSVRLSSIALPPNAPLSVDAGVAYSGASRGVNLELQDNQPIETSFGKVISLPFRHAKPNAPAIAIENITAAGRDLRFSLFPADETQELAIFRNIRISRIAFKSGDAPSILSGALHIRGGLANVPLGPSDRLVLGSESPMILREVGLAAGQLKVVLSASRATTIQLGDDQPRDLRPSLLQWLMFRWPNELYAALSAVIALWIGTRRWWRGAE
jgi:hypothetical protein